MLRRLLVVFLLVVLAAGPAAAQAPKIAVIDFQAALQQTKEGQAAQKKLDAAFQQKKAAIESMETQLKALIDDYQKQQAILADSARQQKEQDIGALQQRYQQAYLQSEQEMQVMYGQLMEDLLAKMKAISGQIGKEKGYTLIIEKSAVVYATDAIDITAELVKRYDASGG